MKKLLIGFFLSLFVVSAQAAILTAKLDQFVSRSATIQGVGSGGGYGRFDVIGLSETTGDSRLDVIFAPGNDFLAFCLEPDQYVSLNVTYQFEIVDLALAPTSPNSGPMGELGQRWIERIIHKTEYGSVEELIAGATDSQEHAFQAALYEAGYEDPLVGSFNFGVGDAVVTSPGASLADMTVNVTQANTVLPAGTLNGINSYGLLNLGPPSSGAQDFMLFTVPEPELAATLGFGLVALGFTLTRRKHQ